MSLTNRGRMGDETVRRVAAAGVLAPLVFAIAPPSASSGDDGRPPDQQRPPSITVNDGAEYTNDPDVTVFVRDTTAADFAVVLSNDAGFGRSERRPLNECGCYPWRLVSSGPESLPRTVYARLSGMSPYGWMTLSDDIILDERSPTVVSARVVGGTGSARVAVARRLRIRALDRVSGVSHMQVTRNPRKPGPWRRFKAHMALPRGHGAIHVRVRDGARNRSRWKTAR